MIKKEKKEEEERAEREVTSNIFDFTAIFYVVCHTVFIIKCDA